MASPQVTGGEDTLQPWRVAVNILNKQSQGNNKGWYSSMGVEGSTNKPSLQKNLHLSECLRETWAWRDSLDKCPKLWNVDMRFSSGMQEVCIGD
jgi:hypothetical protein